MKYNAFAFALVLAAATPTSLADNLLDDADLRLFQVQKMMAAKGDPAAQYYLGEMFENGLGTTIDIKQAFEQYEKSAAKGNRLAKRKLEHRQQIEEDAARAAAAEKSQHEQGTRRAPVPPKPAATPKPAEAPQPAAAPKPAEKPKIVTEAPKTKTAKELAAETARREKLRAQLRDRIKNPIPEPFE